jgi:hypothetical protein
MSRCAGASGSRSSTWARPSTAFIGVRISWLMWARNYAGSQQPQAHRHQGQAAQRQERAEMGSEGKHAGGGDTDQIHADEELRRISRAREQHGAAARPDQSGGAGADDESPGPEPSRRRRRLRSPIGADQQTAGQRDEMVQQVPGDQHGAWRRGPEDHQDQRRAEQRHGQRVWRQPIDHGDLLGKHARPDVAGFAVRAGHGRCS